MNIAVIGATGKSGMSFVKQALEDGHCVTVLARSPEKLTINSANLNILQGNVLNDADIQKVVRGQDAVYIALGTGGVPKPSSIRSEGTQQIINAIKKSGESPHIVILSSLGTGKSIWQIPFRWIWFVKSVLLFVLADHKKQESSVTTSGLPYTILRPTSMHDVPPEGRLKATVSQQKLAIRPAISHDDVASFALHSISERAYINQTVALTHI